MKNYRLKPPQIIISAFLILLIALSYILHMDLVVLLNQSMVKLVMNGVLVLSLIPMLNVGAGMNFGLPVGIIGGLVGMCLAVNFRMTGFYGFFMSILFTLMICTLLGWIYGLILNRVKGREEIAGTFIGFSFIPLMNYFWTLAPFQNREMLYPIGGQGLRPKISLENYFNHILDNFGLISIGNIEIPVGLIFVYAIICLFLYLYFRTKIGRATIAVGENEAFAKLSGINISQTRLIAIIISTIIAGFGICIYAQSYGFIQLYDEPLSMAFPAVSAILIGGSTGKKTFIFEAILGTYLLQSMYLLSVPIANEILVPELTEILRSFITYGIILYALLVRERRGINS
ncbi:ABC transporter permease subunit [Syntrophomonas wolfei]|uniref:ABC transporter integral membrane protein n=1 Tax=Syntrophomonas wolfei subsp. wolfei (strain DSM 2245B / Goettingen) TaxID=335541 RepID=Q0AZV1_SYNWW|nr:ABC transporter [Syntrophomonas wolfei]ABI67753.1 ABC transporter integral membrane protein [Syntrophomonas wolfei subsp. wolfei str. Goettingen G311]